MRRSREALIFLYRVQRAEMLHGAPGPLAKLSPVAKPGDSLPAVSFGSGQRSVQQTAAVEAVMGWEPAFASAH